MLIITVKNMDGLEEIFAEITTLVPEAYTVDVNSFDADSFTQIIIPLAGAIAGSSVFGKLIEGIFKKDFINIEAYGVKISGDIKTLPEVIKLLKELSEKNNV